MANRLSSRSTGSDPSRTKRERAAKLALLLHKECSVLLELYKKKESFTKDMTVADARLVSVPPRSSQLDDRDKLWRLHSALLQCRTLLERAIAKEEEELGDGRNGEYETQRNRVKDRLSYVSDTMGDLLRAADGNTVPTPDLGVEVISPSNVFELKRWVYQVFQEVEYWARTASTTLQELSVVKAKAPASSARPRSTRSARR